MHGKKKRDTARKLRRGGQSLNAISAKLGISKSTASRWCKDIVLTEEQTLKLAERDRTKQVLALQRGNRDRCRRAAERRERSKQEGRELIGTLTDRDLLLLGVGLYWGDGQKRDRIGMTNMRQEPLQIFIEWARLFGIVKSSLKAQLATADGTDGEDHKRWWCKTLGLDSEQFYKITVQKQRGKGSHQTSDREYHGVLSLRISDIDIHCRILGMLDQAAACCRP